MILERVNVAGFGRLPKGLSLALTPGFNLLLARNEAGKTTLCEFIRELLFGFFRKTANTHPRNPWQGGQLGGELVYSLADGRRVSLNRHLSKQRGAALVSLDGGQAQVLKSGEPGEEHLGVTAGVFDTLAVISLDDLQQAFSGAGKQHKDTAGNLLAYFFQEAATAGQVANPVEVLAEWQAEREALYSTDRRKGKTDQRLLAEIEAAERALGLAGERERQAAGLRREIEVLAGKLAAMEKEQAALARSREAAAAGLEAAKKRERLAQLEGQARELSSAGLAEPALRDQAGECRRLAEQAGQEAWTAGEEAAKTQAQSRDLAGGQAPERLIKSLEALQLKEAGLTAREQDLARERERNTLYGQSLARHWNLSLPKLSQAPGDLAASLARAREEAAAARERADLAQAKPGPWPLLLGLLLLAGAWAAAAWLLLRGRPWPPADWATLLQGAAWWIWALAGGGAALTAGAAWWQGARSARWRLELDKAQEHLTRTNEALARLAEPWGIAPDPEQAARLMEAAGQARDLLREAEALQMRATELAGGRELIVQGVTALGMGRAGGLAPALAQAREAQRAAQKAQDLAQAAAAAAGRQQKALADFAGLLAKHGLADWEALLAARRRFDQVAGLVSQMDEVRRGLGEALAGPATPEAQAALQQAEEALVQKSAQLREESGRLAELKRDLAHLQREESSGQARSLLDRLREQRKEAAARHDALLLAEAVLRRAMEQFRLSAQPGLMKLASGYLSRATAGRYQALVSDLFPADRSKEPAMTVKRGPGDPEREAELLSRGARDQLYLALRLALADQSRQNGEPLPLILDDPLVNFDQARLAESLAMLKDLAGRRQVLLLTCHPRQAETAVQGGGANLLEL